MSLSKRCDLIVIGASAGGLPALKALVHGLPASLDAAVLVVMHLEEGRRSLLAEILQRAAMLEVAEAEHGDIITKGRIYTAIAGHQMTVVGEAIHVLPTERVGRYRPSIDALFRSAASAYGSRVAGVVMSGRLRDGTDGLRSISAHGGVSIVQDPREAEHPSMPLNAIEGDHVQFRLTSRGIAELLGRLAGFDVTTGKPGWRPEMQPE